MNGFDRSMMSGKWILTVSALVFLVALAAPAGARADTGYDAFERGDYATAYREWKPHAERGDPVAQYNLGMLHRIGRGVAQDYAIAARWYGLAAEQGDASAQLSLADLYAEGSLGETDAAVAAEFYRRAALQGLAEAQRKLGVLYIRGQGVARDHDTALNWLRQAAVQGDGEAQEWLGGIASEGIEQARLDLGKLGDACPWSADRAYDVVMQIDVPQARLHHDRSRAELNEISFHSPRARVLGLANTGLQFKWRVRYTANPFGDGFCFWVNRVELTLRYPSPDIYVAREYRPGTCQFRVILEHEKEHYRISRAVLRRYAPRLQTALASLTIPTGLRPVLVDSPEAARDQVQALMRRQVDPIYREMAQNLRQVQAEIDSPTEYRRTFKQCRDW